MGACILLSSLLSRGILYTKFCHVVHKTLGVLSDKVLGISQDPENETANKKMWAVCDLGIQIIMQRYVQCVQ